MDINTIMKENKVDGILITSRVNIRYVTGFKGTEGFAYINTKGEKYLFVDSRYIEVATKECSDSKVILIEKADFYGPLNEIIKESGAKAIGFEKDQVVVANYEIFKEKINAQLVGLTLEMARMIKSESEINLMKKAAEITDKAYSYVLSIAKAGMSEKELNLKLLNFILEQGADGFSFDTIVASGKRSSMPHGTPTDKKLENGDLVTLDFGVFYQGYASDMTRTFLIGDKLDPKLEEIYHVVKEAQEAAIKAIKPGMKAIEVDKVARDYITEKGYGEYFSHGTGHSLGLEIHEFPYINTRDNTVLEPGMIITIEPGIYLPDFGGVRIEDDILITEDGYEVITHSDKNLLSAGV